jgi:hypothetical protein
MRSESSKRADVPASEATAEAPAAEAPAAGQAAAGAPNSPGISPAPGCCAPTPATSAPVAPVAPVSMVPCGLDGRSRRMRSESSKWADVPASEAITASKAPALQAPPRTPPAPATTAPVRVGPAAPIRKPMPPPANGCITNPRPERSGESTSGWSTSPKRRGSGWSGRAREHRWPSRCPDRWRCVRRRS